MRARMLAVTAGLVCLMCASVAYAVTLNGTNGPEALFGTTGDDTIDAKGGVDIVFGLSGDDRIEGGGGGDIIHADGTCPAGAQDPAACQQIGGRGNDRIDGNAGDDNIGGDKGDDRINGGSGLDNIQAGSGKDTIDAGDGNDTVAGQGGADRITGGAGTDDLIAGAGDDTVYARDSRSDRVDCGTGRDTAVVNSHDRVARNCERVRRP